MPLIPKPRLADREGFPLIQVPIERRLSRGMPVQIRLGSKRVPAVFIGCRWRKAGARAHRAELRAMGVFKLPKTKANEGRIREGSADYCGDAGLFVGGARAMEIVSRKANTSFTPTQRVQASNIHLKAPFRRNRVPLHTTRITNLDLLFNGPRTPVFVFDDRRALHPDCRYMHNVLVYDERRMHALPPFVDDEYGFLKDSGNETTTLLLSNWDERRRGEGRQTPGGGSRQVGGARRRVLAPVLRDETTTANSRIPQPTRPAPGPRPRTESRDRTHALKFFNAGCSGHSLGSAPRRVMAGWSGDLKNQQVYARILLVGDDVWDGNLDTIYLGSGCSARLVEDEDGALSLFRMHTHRSRTYPDSLSGSSVTLRRRVLLVGDDLLLEEEHTSINMGQVPTQTCTAKRVVPGSIPGLRGWSLVRFRLLLKEERTCIYAGYVPPQLVIQCRHIAAQPCCPSPHPPYPSPAPQVIPQPISQPKPVPQVQPPSVVPQCVSQPNPLHTPVRIPAQPSTHPSAYYSPTLRTPQGVPCIPHPSHIPAHLNTPPQVPPQYAFQPNPPHTPVHIPAQPSTHPSANPSPTLSKSQGVPLLHPKSYPSPYHSPTLYPKSNPSPHPCPTLYPKSNPSPHPCPTLYPSPHPCPTLYPNPKIFQP
ncbi:hypothetical protein FPV67DRAFT_1445542 [Lyophyllum atratum]|nr:hypothetical protein FPV67DRAFT_1445542 [Lyophyllum atratum]